MTEKLRKRVVAFAPRLLNYFKMEHDQAFSREQMELALIAMFEGHVEDFVEDLEQTLFDPRSAAHQNLRDSLVSRNENSATIFTGHREFSLEKFSAVLLYFVVHAGVRMMTRTKLNKLAFYSDFYHHKATGRSITGTAYRHLPYGPVVDGYEDILSYLDKHDVIVIDSVQTRHGTRDVIRAGGEFPIELTELERETLASVAAKFGSMTAEEISEASHYERAWKDTRTGEVIAYGYSMFLPELNDR